MHSRQSLEADDGFLGPISEAEEGHILQNPCRRFSCFSQHPLGRRRPPRAPERLPQTATGSCSTLFVAGIRRGQASARRAAALLPLLPGLLRGLEKGRANYRSRQELLISLTVYSLGFAYVLYRKLYQDPTLQVTIETGPTTLK